MQKIIILLSLVLLFNALLIPLNAETQGVNPRQEIELIPDPNFEFEEEEDEVLFYDYAKSVAVAPDGSIFVSNSLQHNVIKFSPNGDIVKTFGQKGQGPGDFLHPYSVTILDDKYLIIKDYVTSRRISVFDLNGNYVKIIKTKKNRHGCLALKNNKIALDLKKTAKNGLETVEFYILDIESKKETFITSGILNEGEPRKKGKPRRLSFHEKAFLQKTKAGNLLVAFSRKKKVDIYSTTTGKLIRTFKLNVSWRKIPLEIKKKYINLVIINTQKNPKFPPSIKAEFVRSLRASKSEDIRNLPENYNHFFDVKVDSSGNFLFLINMRYMDDFRENWKPVYHVYSPEGVFKGELCFDFGKLLPKRFAHKKILNNEMVGLFEFLDADDIDLKLLKFKLSPRIKY